MIVIPRPMTSKILKSCCEITRRFYSKTKMNEEPTTHFGFRTVKKSEKTKEVHMVFEKVANVYDSMNDAMSLGIHRLWKDAFVRELAPIHGTRLLDSAGGTGDIAFRCIDYLTNCENPKKVFSHVTICDINRYMLDVGKIRAERLGYSHKAESNSCSLSWREADAENLPFEDESFDAYTIAFGIRNVTRIDKVLNEAYRVLVPGGRFLCLEFSHVDNDTIRWIYDKYSFQLIPVMGILIAGEWQPYQYLVESIKKFPRQKEFKEMIEDAGFRQVVHKNLSCGVVAIHSGFKL